MLEKSDFNFLSRHKRAPYNACKMCVHSKKMYELSYYLNNVKGPDGKWCNLEPETKIKLVLELRKDCSCFQTSYEETIERDTTYPGATFAPSDNNNPDVMRDSSDIDFNPYEAIENATCTAQENEPQPKDIINNWELTLKLLVDRNRVDWKKKAEENIPVTFEDMFPNNTEVMRLLATSRIPQYTFRIGLPPKKTMGFDRGLWFYHSEKFNSELDHNQEKKREMKKIFFVYMYNVWFKRLDVFKLPNEDYELHSRRTKDMKAGIYMALESCDYGSLARELSWWMWKTFKDEIALAAHPEQDADIGDIEMIPLTILDKALEAAMIADAEMSSYELDLEDIAYDDMVKKYGYDVDDGNYFDKDSHQMNDSYVTLKPIF